MRALDTDLKFTVESSPSPADLGIITGGLAAFNRIHVGADANERHLTVFARHQGTVVGGACGVCWWTWLYLDKLWVARDHRGHGTGRSLLQSIEREAVHRACTDAWVETFSFQARDFYEKLGWRVFAVLDGFPPGHRQFSLRKPL